MGDGYEHQSPLCQHVVPSKGLTLTTTFSNRETCAFDVKPYVNTGMSRELRDLRMFNSVRPFLGSIQCANG